MQIILKNTLLLLSSGILSQTLNFFVMLYLARTLGPDSFGTLCFATAFVIYFTTVADFGLGILGAREVARNKSGILTVVGNILSARIYLALMVFFILLFVIVLIHKSNEFKLLLFLTGLGIFPSAFLLEWAFQGAELMGIIALSRLSAAFCYAVAVFLYVKGGNDLLLVPVSQTVAGVLTGIMLIVILSMRNGTIKINLSFTRFKSCISAAFPFGVSLLLIQIIYSFDSVLLGFMRTELEVGYYNAAYKIALILIMFGAAYFDALFPSLAAAYISSHETLKKLQDASARLVVIIAVPLAFGGTILALPLLELFFGANYIAGKNALRILVWAVSIIYCNMIFARGMWACNQQRTYIKIVSFQVVVNIVFNLILIPKFGGEGAAISTVLAEAAGFVFYYYTFSKIVTVRFFNYFLKPFVAALLMSIVLFFLNGVNCLLLVLIGMIVYGLCLYVLKAISRDDFINMKQLLFKTN